MRFVAFVFGVGLLFMNSALARDLGQWENTDPAIKHWYKSLMQPRTLRNMMPASCCGESDAYWADVIEIHGDNVYAIITDDREDAPLGRQHIENGTKYLIPKDAIVGEIQRGNPTGHAILFLGGWTSNDWGNAMAKRPVLCYVPNGGI